MTLALENPVCVALDVADIDRGEALARRLAGEVGMIKIGMEMFYGHGRSGYMRLARHGLPVFLDLKLHDIPNTVARALMALMSLEPRPAITNIHVGCGRASLEAAADVVAGLEPPRPQLIGLTVLTSLNDDDLSEIGMRADMTSLDHVAAQARLARECGLDGVVCSPRDVARVKAECGSDFLAVTPGIRPPDAGRGDQKRTATPAGAVAAGSDVLVIGRPITQAGDPVAAARQIVASLAREHCP